MTDPANESLHAVAARLERVADRLGARGLPGGDDDKIDPERAYQQIAAEAAEALLEAEAAELIADAEKLLARRQAQAEGAADN